MPIPKMILMVVVMAGVTYLIRMLPFTFFRKKITSTFLKSFLYYVPYAVLSAMTFPLVLYSTGNFWTALIGTVIAIIASICKQSLLTVAVIACLSVLLFGLII